ncbi:hypothetical protein A2U01_0058523, partial [Trifolium medium]|nr:hypothetical protein [Trifolium medium]
GGAIEPKGVATPPPAVGVFLHHGYTVNVLSRRFHV